MTKGLLRLVVLAGLLLPWVGTAHAQGWIQVCVDCPKYAISLTDRSLRLDGADHPHVAYGGDHLYYAWHDGTTWRYETADNAPAVGARAALGLDASNNPHIAYYDQPQDAIKYAHRDGGGWHVETLEVDIDNDAPQISLAVDSLGEVHIAFDGDRAPGYGLQYGRRGPTGWTSEYITNPGLQIVGLSLALDGDDAPQIGFAVDETLKLGHAYREDDGWHTVYADTGLGRPYDVSFALDAQGRPMAAMNRGDALLYGWNDGAGWLFEVAANAAADGLSLALDGDGRPWVSHHDRGSGQLLVSHKEGAGWQTEVALAGDDPFWVSDTSLALDGSGLPRVVTNRRTSVEYVHKDGGLWLSEAVEPTASVGRYNALAIDSNGYAHVAYYDGSLGRIKYARNDAMGWHLETLPIEEGHNAFGRISLALDGSDRPHVVYSEYDPASSIYHLRYVYWNGLAWQAETIADDWAWYVSLALSEGGEPHVSYYVGYPDHDIKYAHRVSNAWAVEVVHGRMDGDGCPSLDVDALGIPHIAYSFDAYSPVPESQIVYGSLGASGWQTETVDAAGGGIVSLELDGSGAPHIAFSDFISLKYARRQPGGWELEIVDDGQLRVSLALDGAGVPSIAYVQRGPNYDQVLRIARREGSAWQTSSIHTNSSWGDTDLSLDLDASGRGAISFHDRDNQDLKVALSYLGGDYLLYVPLVTR